MAGGPWFYCLKHNTVEPKDGCAERHRLGPYEKAVRRGPRLGRRLIAPG
jgi:hypothetical protein